ncbi:MAG: hypothetical protein AABY16_04820 [Nanoarchaeota archaeon]
MKDYEKLKKDIMKKMRNRQMREAVSRAKEGVKRESYGHLSLLTKGRQDYHELMDEKLAAADYETRQNKYSSAYASLNSALSTIEIGAMDEGEAPKYLKAIDKRAIRLIKKITGDEHYPIYKEEVKKVLALKAKIENEIKKRKSEEHSWLERAISGVIGFGGILAGFFLLSPEITGNVIGNLSSSTANNLSMISFFVGIAGLFVFFRAIKR